MYTLPKRVQGFGGRNTEAMPKLDYRRLRKGGHFFPFSRHLKKNFIEENDQQKH